MAEGCQEGVWAGAAVETGCGGEGGLDSAGCEASFCFFEKRKLRLNGRLEREIKENFFADEKAEEETFSCFELGGKEEALEVVGATLFSSALEFSISLTGSFPNSESCCSICEGAAWLFGNEGKLILIRLIPLVERCAASIARAWDWASKKVVSLRSSSALKSAISSSSLISSSGADGG